MLRKVNVKDDAPFAVTLKDSVGLRAVSLREKTAGFASRPESRRLIDNPLAAMRIRNVGG